jgi:putative ubiquitin-RnfH superfamily antitoxin RatB of RatAB toxin-antitoxin module
MAAAECISVEVVYALPERQEVINVRVGSGATVAKAVHESGVLVRFPELALERVKVGVFGRRVSLDRMVRPGDRIEIYRELIADPKAARRLHAERLRARHEQPVGREK